MTITESCTCGASITVYDRWTSDVERQVVTFREAHAACRERPPAPPPREPRVRMYRVSRAA